jgi:hypothetical protein
MIMKSMSFNRLALSFALLAAGAFTPNLHAGWGSIQGNNHSAPRSAPRSAPMRSAPPVNQVRPEPRPEAPAQERPEARPEPAAVRQQSGFVNETRLESRPVYNTPAAEADRRRMDIDGAGRQSYFWSDYHAGMNIGHLPDGYHRIGVRGHDFFYCGGVFYDTGPEGYVVVAPPLGADVPDLPPGAETITGPGNNIFYYADGVFYVPEGDGYSVVTPPFGVTVSYLPSDATSTVINGVSYYQAYGIWYQPVFENGVTAYMTVPQPG